MKIPRNQLLLARKFLALGHDLSSAARVIDVTPAELDLSLWNYATRVAWQETSNVRTPYLRSVS